MSRRLISSGSPFEAAYGYSRAVVTGGFVFVAGTTGYDYATMTMPEEAAAQAEACWRTIASVLAEAGSGLERIVRATYYVTDRADAEAVLAVCGRVLVQVRPAATLLVVAGLLRPEMKLEIEVTATLG
ncbi:RidA family protein [Methylobacterium sp. WL6]|uniref:RidA family protein n=1 Tax=Methylobacterium sp. WL6 TaxID=2603901 RepID=UPI0011C93596|nr:RidA family protein [Methylobacterium sp. WL6]TXN64209.1 RidA family protein [Methylobacterium sp. WL6]